MRMHNLIAGIAVALLLTACGTTQPAEPTETGYITLDFRPAISTAQADGYPEPTGIRVIITHSNGFRLFRDYRLPINEVQQIQVPARDGYIVSAYSYLADAPPNERWLQVLKDGVASNVDVRYQETTDVSLTLQPVTFTFEGMPAQVVAGEQYSFTVARHSTLKYYPATFVNTSVSEWMPGYYGGINNNRRGTGHPAQFEITASTDYEGQEVHHLAFTFVDDEYRDEDEAEVLVFAAGPIVEFGQTAVVTNVIPTNAPGSIDLVVVY